MFTGLIKELATLESCLPQEGGQLFKISKPEFWSRLELGESICVNGACLTLTKFDDRFLEFFVGEETLAKTGFSSLKPGARLNLEQSLRLGDRLGGHLVSGHVDGMASVTRLEKRGGCLWFQIKIPLRFSKWIIEKGSLAVNGVSLTINHVKGDECLADFFLIPETLERTNLRFLQANDQVNIECDQIVKVISQQMSRYGEPHEQHR